MKTGRGMQLGDTVEFTRAFFRDEAREAARRFLTPGRLLLKLLDLVFKRTARETPQTSPPGKK